ncbi:MAG: HNH endonuclease family protein, partial [Hyphomonas sp.]
FQRAKFTDEEASAYAERWSEHEAALGGSAFDDLLRQIRSIYDKSGRGELVSAFPKAVLSKVDPRTFLDEVLPRYVNAYQLITTGEVQDGPNATIVSDKLNQMRALDQSSWRAPALKFLVERGVADPKAPEFFTRLERQAFIIMLVVTDRDQRNRRFNKVMDAITNDRTLFAKSGPLSVDRSDARKARERMLGRFATFAQRRAMALRLNAALEDGLTIPPESDATVEHVLPRNIHEDSHWLTVWPDPAKRREQCDTLGNFVLLTHKVNQKADRQDYRAKKDVYFNGGGGMDFALTRDLQDQHAWTADVVRKRTEMLVNILCEAWGI